MQRALCLLFFLLARIAYGHQYLKDLEELGYCVIPEVLCSAESAELEKRVWNEFIEKAWPQCRRDDRSNWKETFPIHQDTGIFAGPAGQTQVMWDLRQDPRIVNVFAQVWGTDELIVSMDGMSFMCPPEIRTGGYARPWPHVDQSILIRQDGIGHSNTPPEGFVSESLLKTKPYTIQGQFLFEDSFEGDGGFYCIPGSHLKFDEFAPQMEALGRGQIRFLTEFFKHHEVKHVTAPRGSLILWDSRTVHWNQFPSQDRSSPRVRMVGYLCYVPKTRLTDEGKAGRREAFEQGVATGHNPVYPELKFTKDHIEKKFERYMEDATYLQPKIRLTPLGEAVLGL